MNQLLHLKGEFTQAPNTFRGGSPSIPKGQSVNAEKMHKLRRELEGLYDYWLREDLIPGALISVFYSRLVAKSNRISVLLGRRSEDASESIVGARFIGEPNRKHVITHYISLETLRESIRKLDAAIDIISQYYDGVVDHAKMSEISTPKYKFQPQTMAKTVFQKIIHNSFYVDRFDILLDELDVHKNLLVSIYDTGVSTRELLTKIGLEIRADRIINGTTVLMYPNDLEILKLRAPYLISTSVRDLNDMTIDDFELDSDGVLRIPEPTIEPTIGVIDTLFDKSIYLSNWVDYHQMIASDIPVDKNDYFHGTAVTSLIVDGPTFNPELDDGCGRFRVRHFGVAVGRQFSSFSILKNIQEIVLQNQDIKVWNISLGSSLEINSSFISPEAAILDQIQSKYDVIFVVSGTNKAVGDTSIELIGAPADSINSLVVNSIDRNKQPTRYSRRGPVLSFFVKPDVAYYGGDHEYKMRVCSPEGEAYVSGTSFAAPWVARKLSYLIDILGMSREVAKALIIDSTLSWEETDVTTTSIISSMFYIGHGVVPIHIEDIVKSKDDEIQFVLSGQKNKYMTYNYNIPVPVHQDKHPFIARATLCYFPVCSRNQGVDYTNTEILLKFGRVDSEGKSLKSIDDKYQQSFDNKYLYEAEARNQYRKWDNVKIVKENYSRRLRPKKNYGTGLWGLELKTMERLKTKYGNGINFGLVITLKEQHGVNRIDEFIKLCMLRGWIVNTVDIQARVNLYNLAEETIEFDLE